MKAGNTDNDPASCGARESGSTKKYPKPTMMGQVRVLEVPGKEPSQPALEQ